MASTQPAGGSAEGPKPPEGNKLKRLLLRYDPPALGAEFTDPTGQLVVRRVALPDLREQHIDLGDLASQIVEIEPDIHIRHKPMVFKILLRLEQELCMKRNKFFNFGNIADKFRSKGATTAAAAATSPASTSHANTRLITKDDMGLGDMSSRGSTPQPINPVTGKDAKITNKLEFASRGSTPVNDIGILSKYDTLSTLKSQTFFHFLFFVGFDSLNIVLTKSEY